MPPQAPWSPTAQAFAQHQFFHVANFWRQGRQASFRLDALPGGKAELNLTFQLPPASYVVPPPTHVSSVPAPQRPIHPLFPRGCFPKKSDAGSDAKLVKSTIPGGSGDHPRPASPKVSSRQRKSYRRSVMHRAALATTSLPPPVNGSLRQAASACVNRLQAERPLPVNNPSSGKRMLSSSPSAPSPSNCSPLAQRMRSDFQIGENEESPEKEALRSQSSPENSLSPLSPQSVKSFPSPAPLIFTPTKISEEAEIPIEKSVNCSNCEEPMSPTHQCCVTAPCTPSLARPPAGVNVTFSDGRSQRLNMMKFCNNCDTLYPLATGCQSCVTPVKLP